LKKDQTNKQPLRYWLRKLLAVILLAMIAFTVTDGYFNEWKTTKRLLYWNRLELKEHNDSTWRLTARIDFRLIGIPDVRTITVPESLIVFDQPLRDSGYYRLYFRLSDTASVQLQKMYQTLSSLDTSGILKRSLEDAKKAFQNIQVLLGTSPAPASDTAINYKSDSAKQFAQINLTLNTDNEAAFVVRKLLGTPQIILGVGIGMALSAGIDLLRGDAYCAFAKSDIFRTDSLKLGAYAGSWEGMPIDVLWAMKKIELQQSVNISNE
jgi:hypothetical protein